MSAALWGGVDLSDAAERAVRCEAQRVGGYVIDGDVAATCSAAHNLIAECEAVLEACSAVRHSIIQDRPTP